jgi:hypothetical protein
MNKKIKFHYIYNDDYSPEFISGITTSISPNDNLELNFYQERSALPKSEVFALDESGRIEEGSKPLEIDPAEHNSQMNIVRHIKSGIILDKESALDLKELLEKYIKIIEQD